MKIANVIEGGIAGATTLTLLQEALNIIDHEAPRPLLHKSGVIDQLKKNKDVPERSSEKLYLQLVGELLANAACFGLIGLGKKKNAPLRGGLLGLAAGLGSAFLWDSTEGNEKKDVADINGSLEPSVTQNDTKEKLLTIALYTASGLLTGVAIKQLSKKNKKRIKRKLLKLAK